jgi:hypothetical protein
MILLYCAMCYKAVIRLHEREAQHQRSSMMDMQAPLAYSYH